MERTRSPPTPPGRQRRMMRKAVPAQTQQGQMRVRVLTGPRRTWDRMLRTPVRSPLRRRSWPGSRRQRQPQTALKFLRRDVKRPRVSQVGNRLTSVNHLTTRRKPTKKWQPPPWRTMHRMSPPRRAARLSLLRMTAWRTS
uniref:Alternative protein FGD5 n=1 Tax=Homo sapiens TaxID=9606 RepID=L0R6G7_HUMAN|nr:alternative protein FGD5 [Homo sapiens]